MALPPLLTNDQIAQRVVDELHDAMDVSVGAKKVIVMMSHVSKRGEPKLLERCSLPLTGQRCVKLVVTDIGVVEVTDSGFLLREVAPGWSADDVIELTGAPLAVAEDLRTVGVRAEATHA